MTGSASDPCEDVDQMAARGAGAGFGVEPRATQPEPAALWRGMFGAEGHHRTQITDMVRTCSLQPAADFSCRGLARKGLQ